MQNKYLQWIAAGLLIAIIAAASIKSNKTQPLQPIEQPKIVQLEPEIVAPKIPQINNPLPHYLNYQQIVSQLQQWNAEASDLTEVNTYGKSNKGNDLYYIQITNKLKSQPKAVVLIHASIHGNEPLSTSCIMGYTGNLLAEYGKNQEITQLIDSRQIYFVPVVSPDSYPNSRFVDNVDPNRDYPTETQPNHQSTTSVKAIQDFFLKIKPKAVISGHTYGRMYLYPYGYKYERCPNEKDYQRILQQMCQLSHYSMKRACELYSQPISGGELDWYYKHGAFTIVCEFGTHQRIPSPQEIKSEYDMTWKGFLYFLKEAPMVEIFDK
jgi:hypothetical protein